MFSTVEMAYALGALVVLGCMCMLYPLALRHADTHAGDSGAYGRIFAAISWVLKVANVAAWSVLAATMLIELNLPLNPWLIATSTALATFSIMDMDSYLAKRRSLAR